jgi:hypothetical protein
MLQRRSAKKYGDSLSSGRKLGNHMPRIASGDGNEDFEAEAREERRKQSSKPLPIEPEQNPIEKRRSFTEEQRRTDARREAEAKLSGPTTGARAPLPSQWDAPKALERERVETRQSAEEQRPADLHRNAETRLSGPSNGTRAPLPSQWDSPSQRVTSSLRDSPFEERRRTDFRTAAEVKLNGASHGSRTSISSQWENRKVAPPPISPFRTAAPAPLSPSRTLSASQDMSFPSLSSGEDVVGVPGRLHLSRNASAPPTPLKTRPMSGLWADVQRHLIQAYEYMCHVGEAQQWIEGCLGEELGFGVVEMDEGLRNGVVLARLAQVWDGASVRKIFDVRKS